MASESSSEEQYPTSNSNSLTRTKHNCSSQEKSNHCGRISPSQSANGCQMRTSLLKLCQEKKAKRMCFFRNGDRFFKGFIYALSPERIRTFDALLEDLTRLLTDQVNLSKGVRYVFVFDGTSKVYSLEQLQEGASYVCSSTDHFVKLDYGLSCSPQRGIRPKNDENLTNYEIVRREPRHFVRPKLITIVRNGVRPRKVVRLLLNKKSARSFEQVMNDITDAIKLDTGAVRKLFTLNRKQVMCLEDFFGDDDVFIAYGLERYSRDDFDLDSEECKHLYGISGPSTSIQSLVKFNQRLASPNSRRRALSPFCSSDGLCSVSERSFSSGRSRGTYQSCTKSMVANRSNLQNGHCITAFPLDITEKYEIEKVIGDGNFAVVYECVDRTTRMRYALKAINKERCRGKEQMIANEVAILRCVKHPNIVQLIEEYDLSRELYLVMELVTGGDLFDAIATATKYTEKDASRMVHNLASALMYLHSLNIVHRDIKPENLLVVEHSNGTKSLKLGDFGLAVQVIDLLYTVCGTPTYVAPEILAETGYGLKVDVWAAGVITYILLCGFPPFISRNNDQDELFDNILSGRYAFTFPYWDGISESAKELITHMLQVNPEKRYSAAQVLQHPWVSDDTALDNDMHHVVSQKLSMHFDHKPKQPLKPSGIPLRSS